MPLTYSAAAIQRLAALGGHKPIVLLDIQLADGTIYYLSDAEWTAASIIPDNTRRPYTAWIKSAGPFRMTRDQKTDAGDVVLQNLSGNSIQRDMMREFASHEFENGLAVLRLLEPLQDEILREFHATITEPLGDEQQFTLRLIQLSDPQQFDGPFEVVSEQCGVRYKGPFCGSASGLATCARNIPNCTTRGALTHFNGAPFPPPKSSFSQAPGGGQ